jgi:hypothetical protein
MSGGGLCEAEIAREAKRIFRKLAMPGAHIASDPEGPGFALFISERATLRRFAIAPAVMREFLRRDWLRARGTNPESWQLSSAGEGWYLREMSRADGDADGFAAQHQLRSEKLIETEEGTRRVLVNEGESPLGWLKKRSLIDNVQFEAGERLRRDYTLAQLTPRLGADLSAPMVLGRRGAQHDVLFSDTVLAAKQRFRGAMSAMGPGLGDLLFDVCCHLTGLAEIEQSREWPRRSAKVVLEIALNRLATHYGMRMTGRAYAPTRVWKMEGKMDEEA